jgi:leucyl aminopeptidase
MDIKIHTNSSAPKDAVFIKFTEHDFDNVLITNDGVKTIHVGAGKELNSRRKLVQFSRKIVTLAKTNRAGKIAMDFTEFAKIKRSDDITAEELAEIFATNVVMANFEFTKYKTESKNERNFVTDMYIQTEDKKIIASLIKGQTIGTEVNKCRFLANTPGGDMTPTKLAEEAKAAVRGTKVKVTVFGLSEIKKLKMGGILGVSRGSSEEPRFIVMEYLAGAKNEAPIVLVGKGITFDSGGLNIKPNDSMYEMHMDMSGGAAVIHSLVLAAQLGIKKNIVGLIPAAENMPSGSSYHPGDILRTMSGKTIEVINTDAEGRIILADALTYAEKYKPRLVIDVATLTGAIAVALGNKASGIFSRDEKVIDAIREAGEKSGDYVWPMPLWDEYEKDIKGTFGDWSNTGKTRYGGAITGAMFLYQFAKNYPWVHIDIASRMTAHDDEFLAKGAAGAPVRLLAKFLETY